VKNVTALNVDQLSEKKFNKDNSNNNDRLTAFDPGQPG